jgi:predicted outer membrane repeat protein
MNLNLAFAVHGGSWASARIVIQLLLTLFVACETASRTVAANLVAPSPSLNPQASIEQAVDGRSAGDAAMRTVWVRGSVRGSDGTASSSAVVLSDLGGQVATDSDGAFELPLQVRPGISRLRVSAFGRDQSSTSSGQLSVVVAPDSDRADAGVIQLASTTQCNPAWLPTFGDDGFLDKLVLAMEVFDDGSGEGPALYVGGTFENVSGVPAKYIAKWDGHRWSLVGNGAFGQVFTLAVCDDGSGSGQCLYAGGYFTPPVARWNGTEWSFVGGGLDGAVNVLLPVDSPNPNLQGLFAGGSFHTLEGGVANRVARWNGVSWLPLQQGVDGGVMALAFDDSEPLGGRLWVGGYISNASGTPVNNVAVWDGTSWSAAGTGLYGVVRSLLYWRTNPGLNGQIVAGGGFSVVPGDTPGCLATWDGNQWSYLGGGTNGEVKCLLEVPRGQGETNLALSGEFTQVGASPSSQVAIWTGSTWSTFPSAPPGGSNELALFDCGDGEGPRLFAAGADEIAAEVVDVWDGSAWVRASNAPTGTVMALASFDDGTASGARLFAGGWFDQIGGQQLDYIATWTPAGWEPLDVGTNGPVRAMCTLPADGAHPPRLVVAGEFSEAGGVPANNIATWDGKNWSGLGEGLNGRVNAVVFVQREGTGSLYAGGSFTASGTNELNQLARWDGQSWEPLGDGVEAGSVFTLTADPRSGALVAGGNFQSAGGIPCSGIASWDGQDWSSLGGNFASAGASAVYSTAFVSLGGGHQVLVAGGFFYSKDEQGSEIRNIAEWDGRTWKRMGEGLDGEVTALRVYRDPAGDGDALYATGGFYSSGSTALMRFGVWNGTSWTSTGGGLNGFGFALCTYEDPTDGELSLAVGGNFQSAFGGLPSPSGDSGIARWRVCARTLIVPTEYPTIAAAVDAANDGEVICVLPGEFTESVTLTGKRVEIQGVPGAPATWRGTSSGPSLGVSGVASAGTQLRDLKFEDAQFGAIVVSGSQLHIADCDFSANSSVQGGAIRAVAGATLTLDGCSFTGNSATANGGALSVEMSNATVAGSTFVSNLANHGGAVSFQSAGSNWVEVTGSTLNENVGFAGGGAVWALEPLPDSIRIGSTTICGNSSPQLVVGDFIDLGGNVICPCAADLNGSGVIDGADLAVLLGFWGPVGLYPAADIDESGSVDGGDLAILLGGWGTCK